MTQIHSPWMIPASLASFTSLAGPDLIVIALIFAVLVGIPTAIAIPIVFIISRRKKKPPPLPAPRPPEADR
jgi:hypothetical protein